MDRFDAEQRLPPKQAPYQISPEGGAQRRFLVGGPTTLRYKVSNVSHAARTVALLTPSCRHDCLLCLSASDAILYAAIAGVFTYVVGIVERPCH
jgi:hypothetical protein